jgi:hypothetical protein
VSTVSVGNVVVEIGAKVDGLRAGLNAATNDVKSTVNSIKSLFGALGAVASVRYFAGLTKEIIDTLDHFNDLRRVTRLEIETLAGLDLLAKQTGTSLDATAKGVSELSRRMAENRAEFKRMGIDADDPLEAFKQLSDQFVRLGSDKERDVLANNALGKSWRELVPLLSEGGAKIQEVVDRGARLSSVTTEMAEKADAYNDNVALLKTMTGAWAVSITGMLLPALSGASEWLLRLIDSQTWIEQKTALATEKIRDQTKALNEMAASGVARDIQATYQKIQETEAVIAGLQSQFGKAGPGFHNFLKGFKADELEVAKSELAELVEHFDLAQKRLADLKSGTTGTGDATVVYSEQLQKLLDGLEQEHVMLQKNAREQAMYRAELQATALDATPEAIAKARELAAANYDLAESQRAAKGPAVDVIDYDAGMRAWVDYYNDLDSERRKRQETQRKDEQRWLEERNRSMADSARERLEQEADVWRGVDDVARKTFASILDGGRDLSDRLTDALRNGFFAFLYEMTVKKWVVNIAASVGGDAVARQAFGSAAGGAIGVGAAGLAGGGGLLASGSQFLGGLTGGAIGTNSMLATGASSVGAGINGLLTAIPGWGWALAGVAALNAAFAKKETPSWNAGFLTDPNTPLGKSGKSFQTEAFASGFAPVGFYRRASQSEADQVIDVFRSLDKSVFDLAAAAGLRVSASGIRGLNETLLPGTSGTVFGAGGEDGRPGMTIEQQMSLYVRQLLESLSGQLDGQKLSEILGAGDAAAMLVKLEEALAPLAQVASATGTALKSSADILQERLDLQKRLDGVTLTNTQLLERQRNALDESNRALFDQIQSLAALEAVTKAEASLASAQAGVRAALRAVGDEVRALQDAANDSAADLADAQQRVNELNREAAEELRAFGKTIDEFLATLGPASQGMSVGALKAQLSATSALATAGDKDAQAKLISQAQMVLKAAEEGSATRADYFRTEAFVRNTLVAVRDALMPGSTETVGLTPLEQAQLDEAAALVANTAAQTAYSNALAATSNLVLAQAGPLAGLVVALTNLGAANSELTAAQRALAAAQEDAGISANDAATAFALTATEATLLATVLGLTGESAQGLIDTLTDPEDAVGAFLSALGDLSPEQIGLFMGHIGEEQVAAFMGAIEPAQIEAFLGAIAPDQITAFLGAIGDEQIALFLGRVSADEITRFLGTITPEQVEAFLGGLGADAVALMFDGANPALLTQISGMFVGVGSLISNEVRAAFQAANDANYTQYSPAQILNYSMSNKLGQGPSTEYIVQAMYAAAMAKNADPIAVGAAFGKTAAETLQLMHEAGIPGYATGGYHGGGLRLVGENGPEIEATGPSRIYSASQTKQLLAPDNAPLIAELRALRAVVATLQQPMQETANATTRSKDLAEQTILGGLTVKTEAA